MTAAAAVQGRGQRPYHLRHDLRFYRKHHDMGTANGPAVVTGYSDAEIALQMLAGVRIWLGYRDVSGIGAPRNQAANEGARHVATANEGDAQREKSCHGRILRAARANSAVPTRTTVALRDGRLHVRISHRQCIERNTCRRTASRDGAILQCAMLAVRRHFMRQHAHQPAHRRQAAH